MLHCLVCTIFTADSFYFSCHKLAEFKITILQFSLQWIMQFCKMSKHYLHFVNFKHLFTGAIYQVLWTLMNYKLTFSGLCDLSCLGNALYDILYDIVYFCPCWTCSSFMADHWSHKSWGICVMYSLFLNLLCGSAYIPKEQPLAVSVGSINYGIMFCVSRVPWAPGALIRLQSGQVWANPRAAGEIQRWRHSYHWSMDMCPCEVGHVLLVTVMDNVSHLAVYVPMDYWSSCMKNESRGC